MTRPLKVYFSLFLLVLLVGGVTVAAFTDKASILGSSFRVGSSDIKLLDIIGGGIDVSNLVDEKAGPVFEQISPDWQEDYLVQIYNNSPASVLLSSNANYETASDPEELRQLIFVEPFVWEDANENGLAEEGEYDQSLGRKTIVKWKTEGFDFGELPSGAVVGFLLRFSTDSVPESKQGATGVFDFEFDAIGL